ncbi:MAG: CPBP family intramembrane glutamic endopeptidase [Myxococcota bacterium]
MWWIARLSVAMAADAAGARLDEAEPPSPEELDAARRFDGKPCNPAWSWAFPGVGRFCVDRPAEGAALGAVAVAELSAAAALELDGYDGSTGTIPLTGLQDVYILSLGMGSIDQALAHRRPYTPREDLGRIVSAPFRPSVLAEPRVWIAGGLLTVGAIGLTLAVDGAAIDPGSRPRLFGHDVDPAVAYPAAAAIDVGLFVQVAAAEEVVFRGVLQSTLSRATDPTAGWLLASGIFGAFHLTNLLAIPEPDDRLTYLAVSIPYITLTGTVLGHVYRSSGYRLGPPVAIHFWYDALLGGLAFALDPADNPFSARVAFAF